MQEHMAAERSADFYMPKDKKGETKVTIGKLHVWTTDELSAAMNDYRMASYNARQAIESFLQQLSECLKVGHCANDATNIFFLVSKVSRSIPPHLLVRQRATKALVAACCKFWSSLIFSLCKCWTVVAAVCAAVPDGSEGCDCLHHLLCNICKSRKTFHWAQLEHSRTASSRTQEPARVQLKRLPAILGGRHRS